MTTNKDSCSVAIDGEDRFGSLDVFCKGAFPGSSDTPFPRIVDDDWLRKSIEAGSVVHEAARGRQRQVPRGASASCGPCLCLLVRDR